MDANGSKDIRPMLLKLGVALALSLAGYLRLRPHAKAPAKTADASPSKKGSEDEGDFLLPEFENLLKQELEPALPFVEDPNAIDRESAMESEILYLKNMLESHQEREMTHEIEMLECHGLREQEVMTHEIEMLECHGLREREVMTKELENRLKVTATEAKLFSLKLESLRAENERLQALVADYSRKGMELESARDEIRVLKRRLRLFGEQAKEEMAALQQRISALQEREDRGRGDDVEVEEKLKMLKELEDEARDLRNSNSTLAMENSELKLKLASSRMLNSSLLHGPEGGQQEEILRLREENDKLKKDIEQLHTDRCADVEELVYLRWVNACLRYELRNYQGPPGKAVARDLSKSLSPESEQKAKQLVLDYADFNINERNMGLLEFDSISDCSSSRASTEEPDDISIDLSSKTQDKSSKRSKFIKNLKKLVLGKHHNSKKTALVDRASAGLGRSSVSPCSLENTVGRASSDGFSSCASVEHASGITQHSNEQWQNKGAWPQSLYSPSEMNRPKYFTKQDTEIASRGRCKSDVGASSPYKSILSADESSVDLSPISSVDNADMEDPGKVELRKFAEALKRSHRPPRSNRRSASFSISQ